MRVLHWISKRKKTFETSEARRMYKFLKLLLQQKKLHILYTLWLLRSMWKLWVSTCCRVGMSRFSLPSKSWRKIIVWPVLFRSLPIIIKTKVQLVFSTIGSSSSSDRRHFVLVFLINWFQNTCLTLLISNPMCLKISKSTSSISLGFKLVRVKM